MANYVISKVRVSKPVVDGQNLEVINNAKRMVDETFGTLCDEFSSNVEEVWNEINEESEYWDGVAPECWVDEGTGISISDDQLIFNVISNDYFPLAQLFEFMRDRYYPLCIDVVFADEIADYEIDYEEWNYGNNFEEIGETAEVFDQVGNVGIMRLYQNFDNDASDEEDAYFNLRWRFFFPHNDDEKEKMKKTAWAGCTFSDFINSNGEIVEGENGVLNMKELLDEYPLNKE